MAMIKDLYNRRDGFAHGIYRLHSTRRVTVNGVSRLDAILADTSGTLRCENWPHDFSGVEHSHQIFECALVIDRKMSGRLFFLQTFVEPIETFDLDVLKKLANKLLPRPETVSGVLEVLEECPNLVLQQFIWRVFFECRIAMPFFLLPASRDYHHAYPGGLVEHSLETVRIACDSIDQVSDEEKALAVTAALFHDLGKIRTHSESGKQTMVGQVLRHEQLILEILAKPLEELERQWLEGALALRYLLTYSPEHIKRPLLPIAMAIKHADRTSASNCAKNRAFAEAPEDVRFVTTTSKGPKSTFWNIQPSPSIIKSA